MITQVRTLVGSLIAILTGNFKMASKTGIVIVGMEHSAKYGACPGAALDAGRMVGVLGKYGKPVTLTDKQATKAAVAAALQNAVQNNDLTIFFYSGHGGSDRIGDITGEPDGKNEYLCLYNGYMLDNEIWNIISQAKGRVFMIFDCCHSETMFRSPGLTFRGITASHKDDQETRIAYGLEPRGNGVNMLCWSGCPDAGYSYGSNTGGVLTNAIISSLKYNTKFATYDQIWRTVMRSSDVQRQAARKTILGRGFGGLIFR